MSHLRLHIYTGVVAPLVALWRSQAQAKYQRTPTHGSNPAAVPRRLPFEYQSLGEQQLKGFEEPVRAYAVSVTPGESLPAPEQAAAALKEPKKRIRKHHVAGGVIALAIVVGIAAWQKHGYLPCQS